MRFRLAGGFDLLTGALLLGGAVLVALAIVATVVVLAPPRGSAAPRAAEVVPGTPTPFPGRAAAALPADRVATVLTVDAGLGAASAARQGDHVDVLAYFPQKVTGNQSITRVLLSDVPVLNVDRTGGSVGLTLAVPQESALLLQESQALGAQPFVTLRSPQSSSDTPSSFSDADLANRLSTEGR